MVIHICALVVMCYKDRSRKRNDSLSQNTTSKSNFAVVQLVPSLASNAAFYFEAEILSSCIAIAADFSASHVIMVYVFQLCSVLESDAGIVIADLVRPRLNMRMSVLGMSVSVVSVLCADIARPHMLLLYGSTRRIMFILKY